MPRPKVPLQNRKRALRACTSCRNSKKRCNGQQPCANCVRKAVQDTCVFEDASLHSPISSYTQSAATASQFRSQARGDLTTSPVSPSRGPHAAANQAQSSAETPAVSASSPEAPHRTHPRILDNSQGERVFFGGSASLAFLQLIRDTVAQSLGQSSFSNDASSNHMLEQPRVEALPLVEVSLSSDQENTFLDAFCIATQGVVEVCSKYDILDILDRNRSRKHTLKKFELAVAQTAIAIGAQCSSLNDMNATISRSYFAEAQHQAFEGMIEEPSLELIHLFLLMAFYMLGACHRNAAFMYMGVAARAAYILGLHYAHNHDTLLPDRDRRKRNTWECLVTLDTMMSSIMGRPSATSTQSNKVREDPMPRNRAEDQTSAAMQANYQLACLLDEKVQQLYSSEKVTVENATACLDQLRAWSSRLPTEIKLAPSSIETPNAQKQIVGGLHVSCFYYFAVMLVSRPFLIVHLTNRLAKNQADPGAAESSQIETVMEMEMRKIAEACLNAATYMIQTSLETESYGLLPDDMRVLKAWVFAAGLVLGFEMFSVHHSTKPEIEEAFNGSFTILKKLSAHSAQAAHYHDILASLKDAIEARRRQARSARHRTQNPVVERIMSFSVPQNAPNDASTSIWPIPQATTTESSENTLNSGDNWNLDLDFDIDFQGMMNDPFVNWDSADFLSWDPFSYQGSCQRALGTINPQTI